MKFSRAPKLEPERLITEENYGDLYSACMFEYARTGRDDPLWYFLKTDRWKKVRNMDDLDRALDGETDSVIYADMEPESPTKRLAQRVRRSLANTSFQRSYSLPTELPSLRVVQSATDLFAAVKANSSRLALRRSNSAPVFPAGSSTASPSIKSRSSRASTSSSSSSTSSSPSTPTKKKRWSWPSASPGSPTISPRSTSTPLPSDSPSAKPASSRRDSSANSPGATVLPKPRRSKSSPPREHVPQTKFLQDQSPPRPKRRNTLDGSQLPFKPMPKIWEERSYIEPPTKVGDPIVPVSKLPVAKVPTPPAPTKSALASSDPRLIVPPCFAHCEITWDDVMSLPWPKPEPAKPATLSGPSIPLPKEEPSSFAQDLLSSEPAPPPSLMTQVYYELLTWLVMGIILFTASGVATVYLVSRSPLAIMACVAIAYVVLTQQ